MTAPATTPAFCRCGRGLPLPSRRLPGMAAISCCAECHLGDSLHSKGCETRSNARALDRIAHMLRNPEWAVGMLEDIAEIVGKTGRDVEGDGILSTWDRH